MKFEGLQPFIDFCKRSDEEQKRLYLQGLSKCDGIIKISQHQRGRAVDIYLLDDNGKLVEWTEELAETWHKNWENMGGNPIIPWDLNHFDVD